MDVLQPSQFQNSKTKVLFERSHAYSMPECEARTTQGCPNDLTCRLQILECRMHRLK
ncbi:hypothetical protein EMIT0P12_60088 [Pseudomonas sp. IT-P12]